MGNAHNPWSWGRAAETTVYSMKHDLAKRLGDREAYKGTKTSYLKQQSKHFISIKHVVLVSQWNDEKTFLKKKQKTKKSLIPANNREVFKAI